MEHTQVKYVFKNNRLKSNIRKLRLMSGKTIAEIAEEAKSTRESIYRWEDVSDSRCPSIKSIIDLCNIYNVDITKLLFTKISDRKNGKEINIRKQELEEGVRLILSSFPKAFTEFYKDLISDLKEKKFKVNGEYINKVKEVHQSYIALKIPKTECSFKKPLHFLTIYPNVNRKTLRFVFQASKGDIVAPIGDKTPTIPESAQKLLSDKSKMGAFFTIGYRQRFLGLNSDNAVPELFIKENDGISYAPNIGDIVAISLKTLWLVIEKKRPIKSSSQFGV